MKKNLLAFACFSVAFCLTACSDSATSTTDTGDSTNASSNNTAGDANNTTGSTAIADNTPLSAQDSTFVMKAAMGGMMEVEAGNVAQQNAEHDRVKAFATMMVNDHQKANSELMALVNGRVMLPTELPADMKSHMEEMKKMKGKAFDKHYMGMMVNDHQKTISDFETQANNGTNSELKAWAAKTLPVLQMHRDSATAINGAVK